MTEEYIFVTGADGEIYEVLPTDALLNFLQRLAESETGETDNKPDEGIQLIADRS